MAGGSVVKAAIVGAIAGAVGTAAMDAVWYARYRKGGGDEGPMEWEFSAGTTGYDDAGAPAQTAKKVAELVGVTLHDSTARTMNNAVHWATGIGWGKAHGVVSSLAGTSHPLLGLATGLTAWLTSYATLWPLGIYKPMWEYDAGTLWQDLSAHLVFGSALGLTYRLLTGDD